MIQPRDVLGTPVVFPGNGPALPLARVTLGKGEHNEAWLQALLYARPELLPIGIIEPAFSDAVSVACEVQCAHGYIDHVLVTPSGDIVIVEVKLWRNPQARREMVAQVLDYVAALMSMSYDVFEQALMAGKPSHVAGSLWAMFQDHPDAPGEAAFVDAVSRNLARGRVLALCAGDGIRAEARALASLLQSHAGAHFTFALVELQLWRDAGADQWLCLPSTLLQTELVERGVVTAEHGIPKVMPVPKGTAAAKPHTITGAIFLEQLASVDPALPDGITAFLTRVAPLGVYADQKASLILRADVGGPKLLNLGTIAKSGQLWTDYLVTSVPAELAVRYNQQLARLIGGTVGEGAIPKLLTLSGSAPPVSALLPRHQDAWVEIIAELLTAMRTAQDDAA